MFWLSIRCATLIEISSILLVKLTISFIEFVCCIDETTYLFFPTLKLLRFLFKIPNVTLELETRKKSKNHNDILAHIYGFIWLSLINSNKLHLDVKKWVEGIKTKL